MTTKPAVKQALRVNKMSANDNKKRRLCIAGLITGLIGGVLYLPIFGVGLVIIGSVVLAYKKPLIGGILLIIESLWPMAILAASPLFPSSEALGLAMLWGALTFIVPIFCLPLLASGILFLLSWRERQRESTGSAPSESKGSYNRYYNSETGQYS
jgi:hypothetical protein